MDCNSSCFAYVGDEQDSATWMLPVYIPGDAKKSLNAVKSSLHHVDTAKIPDADRQRVFDTIRGASLALGINVARRTFATSGDAPTAAVPTPPVRTKPLKKDLYVEAVVAEQDRFCNELLRSLGLE